METIFLSGKNNCFLSDLNSRIKELTDKGYKVVDFKLEGTTIVVQLNR